MQNRLGIHLATAAAMRLIDRRDTPLVAALLVGTIVMFGQPLRFVLSVAEDVSATYQVDLVPGLFMFILVLTVHQRMKHRDTATELQLAARSAEDAKGHARSMGQLVAASRALANALDIDTLRREALREITGVIGHRSFCIGITGPHRWDWMVEPTGGSADALAQAGRRLLDAEDSYSSHGDWRLFPLHSGGRRLGMLGVLADEPLTTVDISQIEALSAVLSVSIKNVQLFDELKVNSISDQLTGCFNQAHAFATLDIELRRSKRSRSPLAIVMLDVDGFKRINDEHGHVHGDRMLAAVGETLRRTLRTSDVKCRYGGDEFLAILPDTPPDAATHVAENLRRAIDDIKLTVRDSCVPCHVSVGVAAAEPGELDAVALVHRADEALYRDKAHNHRMQPRSAIQGVSGAQQSSGQLGRAAAFHAGQP